MMRVRGARWVLLMAAVALVLGPGVASATWPGENGRLLVEAGGGVYVWEIGSPQAKKLSTGGDPEWPRWSPDGSQIAYGFGELLHYPDGQPFGLDIWVMDADGSNQRNVSNAVGWSSYPTWSPDGSMIAFHSLREPYTDIWADGDYNIWVMNADGSNQRKLTNDQGWETFPIWSPDGLSIAYEVGAPSSGIEVMDADGGNKRTLLHEPGYVSTDVSWSPDGSSITYTRYVDEMEPSEAAEVYVMDADGTNKRNLTNHPALDRYPVWSPDGNTIIFRSDREGTGGLWSMNADGSDPVPLDAPDEIQYAQFLDWERIQTSRFDDVLEPHTFLSDVEWLAEQDITKGCNPPYNTMYCPDKSVTRGQMAAFLVRALNLTDDGGGNSFTDDNGSIFEADIDKLGTAGVTKGCNPPINDMFCPDDPVTRGQMAAFLVRALVYTDDGGGDLFVDDDDSIFESSIDKLATAGVTRGCNPPVNDQFCPGSNVTRGQMAAFLHRALG